MKHNLEAGTWKFITVRPSEEKKTKCDSCGMTVSQMQAHASKAAFECAECPRLLCFGCVEQDFASAWKERLQTLKRKRSASRAAGPGKKARFTRDDKSALRNVELMVRWVHPCVE
jgi:hypothetical protein